MQAPAPAMIWVQATGCIGGMLAVATVLEALYRLEARHRKARSEQSPQAGKLLRPAGYSALCHLDQLSEKILPLALQALVSSALLGLVAVIPFQHHGGVVPAPVIGAILGLPLIAWCVWTICRLRRLRNEMLNWRLGMRGEQAVAEELVDRSLVTAGYAAFHDIPGDAEWNIDHVVVGPAGVFVLETKTRHRRTPKRQQEKNKVIFDGRVLQFPWCYDADSANQAERNAQWMRKFLAAFPPKDIPVQPIIVLPGWYVESKGNYPIKAMNATYLVGYLKGAKRIFTPEQLEPVIQLLDERCRTLEF